MFKLIRIRKWRVPNALAAAAALLLLASSLAGIERPASPADSTPALAGSHPAEAAPNEAAPNLLAETPVKQARTFRVNLFLFRH